MNQYTDECFVGFGKLERMLHKENQHQLDKWGRQTHSIYEWLTYTTEELGELAKAICEYECRNGGVDDVIYEAIQTATLSLKIAEMMIKEKDTYGEEHEAGGKASPHVQGDE